MPAERRCLPVVHWPALDRQLWMETKTQTGPFDPAGAGAHWSPRSRDKAERGYGRWLGWLQAAGLLDPALAPGDRVTRDRVEAYVTDLATSCAAYTLACRIQELYDALRVLAPDGDWGWLLQLLMTLRHRAVPVRDKRSHLRPISELTALGHKLMAEAEAAPKWSAQRRAVQYRDGLIIALLAYRPVRMRNLVAMRLGQHLIKLGDRYWLVFAASETKSRQPYEAPFPDSLVSALDRYLDHHRPVLLLGDNRRQPAEIDALWVSEVATLLEQGALATRIRKHTRRAFGKSLPPHWFRDAAATSIAIEDPKHVRDARHVLGHASLVTTERHYNQAQSLEASRRHQAVLASLRASLKTVDGRG